MGLLIRIFPVCFLAVLFAAQPVLAATCATITKDGVTWTFDKAYTCGTYANGDYWVVVDGETSKVQVTRIEPDYAVISGRKSNGWEVNPTVQGQQAFQEGCKNGVAFTDARMPSLPYDASAGDSIVKSIVADPWVTQPCLKAVAVLTVVSEAPAGNGAGLFRPPYVGTTKTSYAVANIRTNLLPVLAAPEGSTPPTLAWIEGQYDMVNFDHVTGAGGRDLRPTDNFPGSAAGYGPQLAKNANSAILRLFLNDSLEDKQQALINFLQYTIDLYYIYLGGQWTSISRDGHDGMFLPYVAFFGAMLGDATIQSNITALTNTHEKQCLEKTIPTDDTVGLFGCTTAFPPSEAQYWTYFCDGATQNLEYPDRYGFIEGGGAVNREINAYQSITFSNYKFGALIAKIMGLQDMFNYPRYFGYVERLVDTGLHYAPDPCAPCGGTYGVDYGPDGAGSCIKDASVATYNSPTDWTCTEGQTCGRIPDRDGTHINPVGTSYYTDFQETMWNTYKDYTTGGETVYSVTPTTSGDCVPTLSPADATGVTSGDTIAITATFATACTLDAVTGITGTGTWAGQVYTFTSAAITGDTTITFAGKWVKLLPWVK